MEGFSRYAVYWTPEPGPLAEFGAAWLGWDPVAAEPVPHPPIGGLPRDIALITQAPRKYGLHGTFKSPFRLADGVDVVDLHAAMVALCPYLEPVTLAGLTISRIGGFLALVPRAEDGAVSDLAAQVVRALDGFRAPLTEAEIARRRPERLTPRQRGYLADWGYPYVFDDFRFHLTLTGELPEAELDAVEAVLDRVLEPVLAGPVRIGSLCLFAEATDGRFRMLERLPLVHS
ncbi:DUF1045 domain-containing protein [Cereibacter sphaeroides]|uniref:DUF1045 domain-containing protein n=1 Tax=Cereibacter sphaeroides TaxID=1063 RepID=UPI001F26BED5|nr:DUF1045 domain-containing protein [Cereibacter sphaeroides]MCE6952875.1 DUF1045 domain-containing protein [Cereibacter sphaeroides]